MRPPAEPTIEAVCLAAWGDFMARAGAEPAAAVSCGHDLLAHYREPQRRYHTLTHIRDCLGELGPVRAAAASLDALELALWYHDAVYWPGAPDNELRSAQLALEAAVQLQLPRPVGREAARLIKLTDHRTVPTDPDGALVCDIDLAILGQPPLAFRAYEAAIRQEYRWVPPVEFAAKRAALVTLFLALPAIYQTPHFHARYEAPARRNLAASLTRLRDAPA